MFLALFGIILLRGMRQIRLNDSIQLLRSQNQGDEPPKANLFLTILGIVLLIAGYILANIVKSWIWAIIAFFGAVLLVIAATYILFISGSTIVCGLLKKNSGFYYKKNHFFAVSQISSRMKKNGAGLASICILGTMVLVSFSTVGGLYFGAEKILRSKYPREFACWFLCDDGDLVSECEQTLFKHARDEGIEPQNVVRYRFLFDDNDDVSFYRDNKLITPEVADKMTENERERITTDYPATQFYYIPISDYNAVMGKNLSLNRGEALILRTLFEKKNDHYDLIPVKGEVRTEDIYTVDGKFVETKKQNTREYFKCVGNVGDFVIFSGEHLNDLDLDNLENSYRYRYVFLNDEDFEEQYKRRADTREMYKVGVGNYTDGHFDGTYTITYYMPQIMNYYYGADLGCSAEVFEKFYWDAINEATDVLNDKSSFEEDGKECSYSRKIYPNEVFTEREKFYSRAKGILFLGAMFCAVFIAAAILMMYYKQITEGHEDKSRFHILRQVGMTDKEVRSTINSQVLIMFFMPLLVAGIHTVFAFGLIKKLLMLFGYVNYGFLALVALICYLGYAAIYTIAYKLTSRAYYRIIS